MNLIELVSLLVDLIRDEPEAAEREVIIAVDRGDGKDMDGVFPTSAEVGPRHLEGSEDDLVVWIMAGLVPNEELGLLAHLGNPLLSFEGESKKTEVPAAAVDGS